MTAKEINNLPLCKALELYIAAGHKITFATRDEDIKARARYILRNQKKTLANERLTTSDPGRRTGPSVSAL